MRVSRIFFLGVLAAAASVVSPNGSQAWAESALDHWRQHAAGSDRRLDHSAWTDFLQRYLVRRGPDTLLDYGAVSEGDHAALEAYIADLEATEVTALARPEQKAYWLNLYNAVTVELVLEHYPVASIREIDSGLLGFDSGPWDEDRVTVEGRALSLDDIEHRILRPIWQDRLIHYGVNCAAMSCPNLLEKAFTRERMADMLEANARSYINAGDGVLEIDGETAKVSSIYIWYMADFAGSEAGVLRHLRAFAAGERAAALEKVRRISGHAYDWSLNDLAAVEG